MSYSLQDITNQLNERLAIELCVHLAPRAAAITIAKQGKTCTTAAYGDPKAQAQAIATYLITHPEVYKAFTEIMTAIHGIIDTKSANNKTPKQ